MSTSIALEAQRMVRAAAEPIPPGETIKGQLRRAARALGYNDGDWRIRSSWYGEAGSWSAAAFEDLKERHQAWRERQRRLAGGEAIRLAATYRAMAEKLEGIDAEFHRADVAALIAMARRIGDAVDGHE